MTTVPGDGEVRAHYARHDLTAALLEAIAAAGKDPQALTVDDLAPVDQFHARGKAATLELARRADLGPEMQVLDIGGGLGGAARTIASAFGCTVEVLEQSGPYCWAGKMLTARTGLSDRVTFRQGSGLDLPYPDASFDLVWTQHSSINIADKRQLYAGSFRVLRPGGRLAVHEIMAGSVTPIHFPVPWARQPEINFLLPPDEFRALLAECGFQELAWVDDTPRSLQWFEQRAASASGGGPLDWHLLLGDDFGEMMGNVVRNLQEQRAVVVQGVFERP